MASSQSAASLWSELILVSFLFAFAHGWGLAPRLCETKPRTSDNSSISDRRIFLESSMLTIATIGAFSPQAAIAADSDDPFAALDSFAATVGSKPPSSLQPAPTTGGDPNGASTRPTQSSDISEALKDIRKQKKVDPRTHG